MSISISSFGALPDGRAAALYTLTNPSGAQLCLTDYGARIVAVRVPDRTGNLADVALGFDSAADYIRQDNYIGRDHWPRRQPHRRLRLYPERQGLSFGCKRRPQLPARRA